MAKKILREVVPSLYLFKVGDGVSWLSEGQREAAESALNWARLRTSRGAGEEADKLWSGMFARIGGIRNDYAHAGMRERPIEPLKQQEKVLQIIGTLNAELESSVTLQLGGRRQGTVLITPLGLSRGVLYTILSHEHPTALIIYVCALVSPQLCLRMSCSA
jgi:hypothetical protein